MNFNTLHDEAISKGGDAVIEIAAEAYQNVVDSLGRPKDDALVGKYAQQYRLSLECLLSSGDVNQSAVAWFAQRGVRS